MMTDQSQNVQVGTNDKGRCHSCQGSLPLHHACKSLRPSRVRSSRSTNNPNPSNLRIVPGVQRNRPDKRAGPESELNMVMLVRIRPVLMWTTSLRACGRRVSPAIIANPGKHRSAERCHSGAESRRCATPSRAQPEWEVRSSSPPRTSTIYPPSANESDRYEMVRQCTSSVEDMHLISGSGLGGDIALTNSASFVDARGRTNMTSLGISPTRAVSSSIWNIRQAPCVADPDPYFRHSSTYSRTTRTLLCATRAVEQLQYV